MKIVTLADGRSGHVGGRRHPIVTPATHPHLFRTFARYGGASGLPDAPESFDYDSSAFPQLADILGNDRLGDCTAAGACHLTEAITAAAGDPAIFTTVEAINFYSQSTGYNPDDPSTDQGGDEVSVCTSWRDKGLDGQGAHAIAGWLSLDPSDSATIKKCAYHFGIYLGLDLADSWTQAPADGAVWDVGDSPDPNDGHCIIGKAGNHQGIPIISWGLKILLTYQAIAQFCSAANNGNVFAILTRDAVNVIQQIAPDSLDFDQLTADFDALGGDVQAS